MVIFRINERRIRIYVTIVDQINFYRILLNKKYALLYNDHLACQFILI